MCIHIFIRSEKDLNSCQTKGQAIFSFVYLQNNVYVDINHNNVRTILLFSGTL